MTYIDYLNHFSRWVESNTLPGNAQLLYYKMLELFNRAGWPEHVQVDTLRLMVMTDISDKRSLYRARDKLKDAGLIVYQKGTKGSPSRYSLVAPSVWESGTKNGTQYSTENGTENGTKNGTKSGTKNGTKNGTHIKTKTKTEKEKTPSVSKRKVLSFLLNDGSEHDIYEEDIAIWETLYPAVDVKYHLQKMQKWLKDHPSQRKTKRGVEKFISNWLGSEQDKGGERYGRADGAVRKKETGTPDVDWDAKFTYASPDEEPWSG